MTESTSLATLLRGEQRARWQLGDPVLVEAFLALHPQLQRDSEAVLELIWNELVLRRKQGETPQLADYRDRFGELEPRLPALFQLLHGLDNAQQTRPGSPAGSGVSVGVEFSLPAAAEEMPVLPGYEII